MSRTWTLFLILAIVLMLFVTGYEFFNSMSGANVTFNKTVSPIEPSLQSSKIELFIQGKKYILVSDAELDNK